MDKYMNANMVFSLFSRNYMELKKDLPIRPSEMAVLNIITQRDEKYTPLAIAELLKVSKPMITAHLTVLLKSRYIYKEPCETDRRSFYILPTKKAIELTEKFNLKQAEHLKALKETLGKKDFNKLVLLLNKIQPTIESLKGEQTCKTTK